MLNRAICVFAAAFAVGPTAGMVLAQDLPAPGDLTLRSGDTITWTPAGPHRLQFGGTFTVTIGNTAKTFTLTAPADIEKVLTNFTPPLPPKPASGPDVRVFPKATKVTATVKTDFGTPSVSQFLFTCGAHPDIMVTVPFSIAPAAAGQPARAVQIISDPSLQWLLKTAAGNKTLNVNMTKP